MAITNADIIQNEQLVLVKQGKIKADEPIHTFNMWKELGFKVKKANTQSHDLKSGSIRRRKKVTNPKLKKKKDIVS